MILLCVCFLQELRSCVKVKVAVLGSRPYKDNGLCGRKATLNSTFVSKCALGECWIVTWHRYQAYESHDQTDKMATEPGVSEDHGQHCKNYTAVQAITNHGRIKNTRCTQGDGL